VEFCPEFEPPPGGGIHQGLGCPTDEEQRARSPRRIPWSLNAAKDANKLAADGFHTILRRWTIARAILRRRENSSNEHSWHRNTRYTLPAFTRLIPGLMRQLSRSRRFGRLISLRNRAARYSGKVHFDVPRPGGDLSRDAERSRANS